MQSQAATTDEYLNQLPEERRAVMSAVLDVLRQSMPAGYAETMSWGMVSFEIPLATYPNTYNKKPLVYCALAAQKNGYSLYLMGCYGSPIAREKFEAAYRESGKRMDLGKSCVRFKKLEDLPLAAVADSVASIPPEDYITMYEESRAGHPLA